MIWCLLLCIQLYYFSISIENQSKYVTHVQNGRTYCIGISLPYYCYCCWFIWWRHSGIQKRGGGKATARAPYWIFINIYYIYRCDTQSELREPFDLSPSDILTLWLASEHIIIHSPVRSYPCKLVYFMDILLNTINWLNNSELNY